ncbi:hydrogenase maturation protease [Roseibium sediminicola]|uniref:Hydrogenase maturation protease n=1 Tax=Roseibium sediminicola TaxID=2933272 RepID=A0ABT0GTY3_9HYPH|nr:hydrogenase maturation protease [Roseibium sp. CAU 1639]MCK7612907.1 hydrogenase maturation protease [Roseibium sp. CAU 1639]
MLLIGYGNPGRGDDGLGPAFSEGMAARALPGLEVDTDYQLVAEHALAVSGHELVIFADAEIGGAEAFSFRETGPGAPEVLGSHSLVPETVLALCETLYGARPQAFVLGISGYEYGEVKEGLSDKAAANLEAAESFFLKWLAGEISLREAAHA